ncbi:MAG TPA: hypothetical protein PK930_20605 [Leptospiraceae bacterium]|nr:hypothetical protein [Leptospiraceae bacterium]
MDSAYESFLKKTAIPEHINTTVNCFFKGKQKRREKIYRNEYNVFLAFSTLANNVRLNFS